MRFTQTGQFRKPKRKAVVNAQPQTAVLPAIQVATPRPPPPQVRLSFGPPGTMKPPKRPLEGSSIDDGQPTPTKKRKIVKLRVPGSALGRIVSTPPRPAPVRAKSFTKSASPAPRPSPVQRPSPAPRPSPAISASSGPSNPSASPAPAAAPGSAPVKIRKPLPDSAPRPQVEAAPPLTKKPSIVLKLSTKPKVQQPPQP